MSTPKRPPAPARPGATGRSGFVVPIEPQSVAQVRRYAVQECDASGWDGDRDTIALLVSEVATNALIHGSGDVWVNVTGDSAWLWVEVADASPAMPAPRDAPDDAEGGRRLALVAALVDAWGVDLEYPGKTV